MHGRAKSGGSVQSKKNASTSSSTKKAASATTTTTTNAAAATNVATSRRRGQRRDGGDDDDDDNNDEYDDDGATTISSSSPTLSSSTAATLDRLLELIDALSVKRSSTRIDALRTLIDMLTSHYAPDVYLSHQDTLHMHLLNSIRKGDTLEAQLACQALSLLVLTLCSDSFDHLFLASRTPLSTYMATTSRASAARAACIRTLAFSAYMSATHPVDLLEVMTLCTTTIHALSQAFGAAATSPALTPITAPHSITSTRKVKTNAKVNAKTNTKAENGAQEVNEKSDGNDSVSDENDETTTELEALNLAEGEDAVPQEAESSSTTTPHVSVSTSLSFSSSASPSTATITPALEDFHCSLWEAWALIASALPPHTAAAEYARLTPVMIRWFDHPSMEVRSAVGEALALADAIHHRVVTAMRAANDSDGEDDEEEDDAHGDGKSDNNGNENVTMASSRNGAAVVAAATPADVDKAQLTSSTTISTTTTASSASSDPLFINANLRAALIARTRQLATDASRFRSRKDRSKQRSTFRDICDSLEHHMEPSESRTIGKSKQDVDGWAAVCALEWFTSILGKGLSVHGKTNPAVCNTLEWELVADEETARADARTNRSAQIAESRVRAKQQYLDRNKQRQQRAVYLAKGDD